jgi:hypothetical protein
MANRFWVGGGSSTNWSATANTNWATTSGGANNASVPGTTDVAVFDANSGSGTSVISASTAIQGLDTTNYGGTIQHNSSVTLTLNTGSASTLILGTGMTYSPLATSSIITTTNTSGTADITSNGKRLAALTINGVGGTTRLLDALRVDSTSGAVLTLTNGVFNANNFNVTAYIVSSSNSNTRTLTMGSGTWTIGGNVSVGTQIWVFTTTTGLTFTANTANIVVAANATTGAARVFAGGGLSYPNTLTLNTQSAGSTLSLTGANTFGTVVINPGNAFFPPAAATTTITNAPTWTGTQANPILIGSGGSAATLSIASGSATLTWGGLCGIAATGGATFIATNTFDFGSNSGWSISPPADASVAAPTAAQIATAVWQDTTAGDFTTAGSIGKDLKTGAVPGATNGFFIAGTNAATTVNITGTVSGNLSPTVAGRTLDVTATGAAGIDWANVENQSTANNLSATQIQSVNNLAAGTDSINTIATNGSTLTTGTTSAGTYASTAALDSSYWQIADSAGTLDMYFQFDVGTTGVPTTAVWTGGLTTALNSLKVYAYNWSGAAWDQVGTITGTSSLIINNAQFDFTTAHVGTGGNVGLVRLRFQNTGLTSANFYTDQVLCGYTNVQTFPSNFSALAISGAGAIGTVTNLTNAPTNGDLTAAMKASVTAAVPTAAVNAAAVWEYVCEGAYTALNLIRVIAAACGGKASGLATTTAVYRAADDSKARITATVDVDGNRTAVTLDGA